MRQLITSPLPQPALLRYSFALILPFLALLVARADFMVASRYFPFLVAIIVSAWYGGFQQGFVSLIISLLLIYFLLPPYNLLQIDPSENVEIFIFALFSLLVIYLQGRTNRSAHELLDTKLQLEAVLRGISDGVTATNAAFQPIFVNDAAARLLGYPSADAAVTTSPEQLRSTLRVLDGHDQPVDWSELPNRQAIVNGKASELTYRLHNTETGFERWIVQKSTPIFDIRGTPYMAINILRDVTEQRLHEELLQAERQRLRDLLDNLPALVGVLNPEGVLLESNKVALQVANLNIGDVLDKPFDETYWWSYSPEIQTQLRAAIIRAAAGHSSRYDVIIRVGEDQFMTLDFMLSPVFDEDGRVTFLIPAGVDITARKQMEMDRTHLTVALAAERRRLKTILDNIPGVLWEAKGSPEEGQIPTFISDYVEKLYGCSTQEWLARPNLWQEMLHPEDREQAVAAALAAYQQGGGIIQYRIVRRTGEPVHVETRSIVIQDDSGQPTVVIGVTMDVTERKSAEAALERYAAELKRSNEELQQFAYVASHDLQEPLRMVTSYLQLLEKRYADLFDADGQEFIGYAVDGAARMKSLINDLLAYSRVETGGRALVPTDLQRTFQIVLHDLGVVIDESNARILSDVLPTINADEHQVRQLFLNLIGNAIKFRREGVIPEVQIKVRRQHKMWLFSVQDNGIGMEEQYLERIFTIFQRLHNRTKYPGTGIGLAICRRVIERHGGKIWAESKPGFGSTFYFTLPAESTLEENRHGISRPD